MKHSLFATAMICFSVLAAQAVEAQSETPRFELGVQFTALRLKEFSILDARTISGIGGRFTYNINGHVAIEAEGNYFLEEGLKRTQGLFGIKAGTHWRRVGAFGKARPGFLRFRQQTSCAIPEGCPSSPTQQFLTRSDFAFDVGGVFEIYPSRRLSLRIDIGDTIVRSNRGTGLVGGQPRQLHFTSHNLQFSAGTSFRF